MTKGRYFKGDLGRRPRPRKGWEWRPVGPASQSDRSDQSDQSGRSGQAWREFPKA